MTARTRVVPGLPPIELARSSYAVVGRSHRSAERRRRIACRLELAQHCHRSGDRRLGQLEPALVAAHPVGEREHRGSSTGDDARVPDVLVLGSHGPPVGDPGDLEWLTIACDRSLGAVVRHAPAPASAAAG